MGKFVHLIYPPSKEFPSGKDEWLPVGDDVDAEAARLKHGSLKHPTSGEIMTVSSGPNAGQPIGLGIFVSTPYEDTDERVPENLRKPKQSA
jgi:hypothetical protein